ncbi:MAG: heme exporter protein CcmB, partial [Actinomycetota bacterium]|nr:heme exporter protein CcmB [Actinomycetota bacterium]
MWRDALLIAAKDLKIELRSKVTMNQILPFAFVVLIVFAFALDTSPGTLEKVAPGLFWLAVLFSSIFSVDRAVAIETDDGAGDGLLVYGVDPGGIFLGKVLSVFVQLFLLEIFLLLGVVVLYGPKIGGLP